MNAIDFSSLTSSTTTVAGGSKVYFQILNTSNETLNLLWMDYTGKLISYGTIAPGASRMQDTSVGHVWELTSDDGKVGFKFTPNVNADLMVGSDYQPTAIDHSEKIIQSSNGLWSSTMGYGLVDAAASLGVAHTSYLPMNGQTNYAALNAINAPSAWSAGFTGKGVKVAVIDGGIGYNTEIAGKIVGGYDFQDHDTDPSPDNGAYRDHALGVASIIAANHDPVSGRDTMGVAPDAQLLNVRVGNSQGSSSDNMAVGIRWAVDNGAKVICMPLESNSTQLDQNVANALHYAFQHNVVSIVIGGNYSSFTPTGPAMIAQQLVGEVVDVGNYDMLAGAAFGSSNQSGSTPFPWVMASSSGWVPNTAGGYTYWQDGGTSFAGPYVAGLAALLWQQNPNASAATIISKITAGASLSNSSALNDFKSGYISTPNADVVKAVSGVQYDLGGGVDTLVYARQKSAYGVTHNTDGSFDVTNNTDHTVNHLLNVERLQFTDTSVALDTGKGQLAGEAFRLYQAAFNRAPDASGLSFWMNAMDHGQILEDVAQQFVTSSEFKNLYGANPSNTDLVNTMYRNVLHRDPDAAGMQFWVDGMNHGLSPASLLAQFSESAENVSQVAKIIGQGFDYHPYV